jgi:hypothetical protein
VRVEEVPEKDVRVGLRAARGRIGGQSADLLEGLGLGEMVRIFDEQQDAADLVQRGDGAARDDGEIGC